MASRPTLTGRCWPCSGSSLQANKKAYERLTLGVSIELTVEGDTKSHSLHYVDWEQPENSVYHVASEPSFLRRGGKVHAQPTRPPQSRPYPRFAVQHRLRCHP